ncbi:unnamed protein product [Diatraea saccharalis]|uniref:Uncharacterized protein n=1 Tax=Diatraea saccharalis TaxID=40085 RepID=A0A9N9R274_9NEOP|nr:unnamed protein product [Diatraea saccharalis]
MTKFRLFIQISTFNVIIFYLQLNFRPFKDKMKQLKSGCQICKRHSCVDDKVPKIKCRINTDAVRVTRSVTKLMEALNNFIILEIYRCMPLLGNENEIVPDWNVHIVHYAIVLTNS